MLFTIMAALAQMEHEIKCERVTGFISKSREAGKDLGGRPRRVTDSQISGTDAGEPDVLAWAMPMGRFPLPLKFSYRAFPPCFARYMAESACRRSSVTSAVSAVLWATPILKDTRRDRPPVRNGSLSAS
jgi:hypothetical protein